MMDWQPWQYTDPNGLTLRGWHTPPSGKPVLHFLHGNGFSGRTYEPMLALLAADFDLWLCDLPGHGRSDVGDRFLGWNRNASLALDAFMAHQSLWDAGLPRYALGHSFGGVLTALSLAERPGLFQRVVLLDPVIFTPWMNRLLRAAETLGLAHHTPLARLSRKRRRVWPSAAAAQAALSGRGIFRGWTEAAMAAYVAHAMAPVAEGVGLCTPASLESTIFGSAPQRLWPSLRASTTPVRLIHGDQTYPFVPVSAQRWQRLNPQVEVMQTRGGHCFMQENPAEAADLTRAYLLGNS